jgi:hypothetical protein
VKAIFLHKTRPMRANLFARHTPFIALTGNPRAANLLRPPDLFHRIFPISKPPPHRRPSNPQKSRAQFRVDRITTTPSQQTAARKTANPPRIREICAICG